MLIHMYPGAGNVCPQSYSKRPRFPSMQSRAALRSLWILLHFIGDGVSSRWLLPKESRRTYSNVLTYIYTYRLELKRQMDTAATRLLAHAPSLVSFMTYTHNKVFCLRISYSSSMLYRCLVFVWLSRASGSNFSYDIPNTPQFFQHWESGNSFSSAYIKV